MTESVAASLVVIALACAPEKADTKRVHVTRIVAMGGGLRARDARAPADDRARATPGVDHHAPRFVAAGLVLAVALVVVAPWTARNCVRMNRCALVSVNGGWNLLIGVRTDNGSWTQLDAPDECKEVWDEAAQGRVLRARRASRDRRTRRARGSRRSRASSPSRSTSSRRVRTTSIAATRARSTSTRTVIAGARRDGRVAPAARAGPRRQRAALPASRLAKELGSSTAPRFALALAGLGFAFVATRRGQRTAILAALVPRARARRAPLHGADASAGVVVATTMVTHAVFFGAGRYGLLVVPFVALAAFACVRPKALSASACVGVRQVIAGS